MQTWNNWPGPSLYSSSGRRVCYPVRKVTTEAKLTPCLAQLKVKQHFQNTSSEAVECLYHLGKLPNAVLIGVKANLDGKKVRFRLREKEDAKEEYSDAIASGHAAFMAEDDDLSGITISLGQVPSKAGIILTLKLLYPLFYIQDHWLFIVSKAFIPRHSLKKTVQESEDKFLVTIEGDAEITAVSSSSHKIESRTTGAKAEIRLRPQANKGLNFCLEYTTSNPANSVVFLERDPERSEYVAMVAYKPQFSPIHKGTVTGEYVFMLDRSGSMAGQKMDMVKEAMVFLLKSLPEVCTFNIISFGSRFTSVFPSSQPYNDVSVASALAEIASFQANFGGTDVIPGLQMILGTPADVRYPRNVILLTDGCVSNEDESLSLIRKHRKIARFHAIGLGNDVSETWLQAVGLETQGGFEVIKQAKKLSESLVKALERILTPSFTGIQLTWSGENPVQAPSQDGLGNLYEDDLMYVYAHFGEVQPTGMVNISVFDTSAQTTVLTELAVPVAKDGNLIGKLWAKERISELEADPKNKESVNAISLKYNVPSAETAYIGVCEVSNVSIEPMVNLSVPTKTYKSKARSRVYTAFQGSRGGSRSRGRGRVMMSKGNAITHQDTRCYKTARPDNKQDRSRSRSRSSSEDDESPIEKRPAVQSSPAPGSLLWFMHHQHSDGSWSLETVKEALQATVIPEKILQGCGARGGDVWATLQVIHLLKTRFAAESDKTRLVIQKAEKWLNKLSILYQEFLQELDNLAA